MEGKAVDATLYDEDEEVIAPCPRYEIGEVLAIAQSYKDLGYKPHDFLYLSESKGCGLSAIEAHELKGWITSSIFSPTLSICYPNFKLPISE